MPNKFACELPHGGDLTYASAVFGEPSEPWQDLSTGISPWGYQSENIPAHVWRDLPASNTMLCRAAAEYYQSAPEFIVPVPGSQFAISQLPQLVPCGCVALPAIGYAEHGKAWQQAGHQIVFYSSVAQLCKLAEQGELLHAVLINPNNPTGDVYALNSLESLHGALQGVVVVDEAFIDALALPSAVTLLPSLPRLCVLRSVGKFFGLAGVRLGFFLNGGAFSEPLRQTLQPWSVSHPAQWIGKRALNDRAWQDAQRLRIHRAQQQLSTLLQRSLGDECSVASGGLFVTLRGPWHRLMFFYQGLAEQGIYTRWCHWPEPTAGNTKGDAWLRLGLPIDGGVRLARALKTLTL
ncbi:threonine-phosphate decarboxylase [Gilvimarinus polysaccharolyticus]|uniref:threonine-phosphate decarboxylase n=1 Tax=Gilvimarinus polysaccharolyticus TaxID=863921 RepID=UPI000673AD7D|nr:threonine-phosphate decarboxylase [Gilvimarinus polysaccharolyticus]